MKNLKLLEILSLILIASSSFYFFSRPNNLYPKPSPSSPTTPTVLATQELQEKINPRHFYAPILLYHHIAKVSIQNSYYVSPEIFDKQMEWLKENGFTVISFDDFILAPQTEGALPPKPVMITFDDSLRDQYLEAFPILKKYGYTATFFIKLNNVDKSKNTLNWPDIQELAAAGNIIGSHSLNHDNMSRMNKKKLETELLESKKIIEENIGHSVKYFSYPGGAYSQQTIEAVKAAGYLAAVTTRHRVWQEITNSDDLFTLPRVHIDDEIPTFIDWIQGINLQ